MAPMNGGADADFRYDSPFLTFPCGSLSQNVVSGVNSPVPLPRWERIQVRVPDRRSESVWHMKASADYRRHPLIRAFSRQGRRDI